MWTYFGHPLIFHLDEICKFLPRVPANGKTSSEYEATNAEIHEALVKRILATVDFIYENLNVQLTPTQKTLKNTRIEQVAEFLLELDKVIILME